ncbi:MAG: HAMP domain-containing sensor histidine kinase [Syntrophomonadaceae bacterium]|nr:HAMP domain-containing sensor histidine kinase [Syntrophomonadaceae bacterium]
MIPGMIKRFKRAFYPDSIRVQLLSRSLLILAALLILIGVLQYFFMKDVIYWNKASSLQSQAMSISPLVWEHLNNSPNGESGNNKGFIFIPGANLAFIDTKGNFTVLANGPGEASPPQLDTEQYTDWLSSQPRSRYMVSNKGGGEQLVVLQPIMDGGTRLGLAQISTPTAPLKELLIRQLLTFFLLALAALIFGILGFLPVLKRTLVPLSNMVDTAAQIDAGNLDTRFPTRQGQMEIDHLAESFNGMLERLEASFEAEKETQEQMRRFIADASHELRTPLTSIHGFLEVLLRGAANQPDQLDKALKSMHSESLRLNKLVHDLLLLSKLDRSPHVELQVGSLDTVVKAMEPQLNILAHNRRLILAVAPGLQCRFNTDQMKQVILNLFHNAVQHTEPDQGQIQISVSDQNHGVLLAVRDNGPGISAGNLPYVFDRFYRSDSSRTRKYGGAGLGLSITKAIVDAHGGTIRVVSKEGEGSEFQVWLPGTEA